MEKVALDAASNDEDKHLCYCAHLCLFLRIFKMDLFSVFLTSLIEKFEGEDSNTFLTARGQ